MRGITWQRGIWGAGLLLIALWLLSLIAGLYGKAEIAVGEAHEIEQDLRALEERQAILEANLDALQTERGKDAAIRTAFGVARAGEAVIVVVPPATTSATTTKRWWERLWDWF